MEIDMRKMITSLLLLTGLALFGVAGNSGAAKAQVPKMTDVTFSLDFIVLGRHSPFYVAIEKGFFKEENLNVNIIAAKGTAQAIKTSKADWRKSHSPTSRALWSHELRVRPSRSFR
jgi:ABC-type nitrate/sulfonate/bicarbonate transport system substrate-binding protein